MIFKFSCSLNRIEHNFIEDKLRPHAGGVRVHNTNKQTYLDLSKYSNEMEADKLQKKTLHKGK